MPPDSTLSRFCACVALLLTSVLSVGHHSPVLSMPLPLGATLTGATTPRAGSAVLQYRVQAGSGGEIVERSTDGGASWQPVLSPASPLGAVQHSALATAAGSCSPVLYSTVATLVPTGTQSDQLYVATNGDQGNYLDGACAGTVGGIYAVGSDGAVRALGTTGLPFAQDPVGRTDPSYSIDSLVLDPTHPGTLYVHAGAGTGPYSPPAGLYKSTDAGSTWSQIDSGLQSSTVITNSAGVAVPVYGNGTLSITDPTGTHLQFLNDTGTYVSSDAGAHWDRIETDRVVVAPASAAQPSDTTQQTGPITTSTPATTAAATAVTPADQPGAPQWTWTALSPAGLAPPPRQDAAVTWDSNDHQLLAFGGVAVSQAVAYADFWSYVPATNTWSVLPSDPPARYGAGAAWDAQDGVFLMFGGASGPSNPAAYGDLWAFRPSTDSWSLLWANGAVGGPSPRFHALVTWDSTLNRLLVFGGQLGSASTNLANDLWAFTPSPGATGGTWSQLNQTDSSCTITCPQLRAGAVGGWNPTAGTLRVFGGLNKAGSVLSDTWTWTPTGPSTGTWNQEHPAIVPPGRAGGTAAYDPETGSLVVGPGVSLTTGLASDAWANASWGANWQQLAFAGSGPQPRGYAGWVWDDTDNAFLLFGGGLATGAPLNDLWRFSPIPGVIPPTPAATGVTAGALDEGWAVDNAGHVLVTPAQIAATSAVGARYVRLNFRLGNAADWTNATLLAAYDTVVNAYLAAGIQILGVVTQEATHGNQVDWTANNHENTNGNGDNAFITDDYVRGALVPLLSHFHDRVKTWELWNEPNAYQQCSGTVCTGGSFMYPSNFAALMADAYTAIKDPAPVGLGLSDVTLVSGGILGHSIGGVYSANNAGTTYLLNTYSMGMQVTGTWLAFSLAHQGALPLDAVGQHLYIDQNLLTTFTNISAYLGWIHDVALLFGSQMPTYVTEAAWSTRNLPQPIQAANLDTLFQAAKQAGYVPLTTWFQLQDLPVAGLYFGLRDQTGAAKQSYSHYQAQNQSAPMTPTPTLAPSGSAASPPATPQPLTLCFATPTPVPGGDVPSASATATPTPTDAVSPTAVATTTASPACVPDSPSPTAVMAGASPSASQTPAATPMTAIALP